MFGLLVTKVTPDLWKLPQLTVYFSESSFPKLLKNKRTKKIGLWGFEKSHLNVQGMSIKLFDYRTELNG